MLLIRGGAEWAHTFCGTIASVYSKTHQHYSIRPSVGHTVPVSKMAVRRSHPMSFSSTLTAPTAAAQKPNGFTFGTVTSVSGSYFLGFMAPSVSSPSFLPSATRGILYEATACSIKPFSWSASTMVVVPCWEINYTTGGVNNCWSWSRQVGAPIWLVRPDRQTVCHLYSKCISAECSF